MTNLDQLAAELDDPDERTEPRDQNRLDAINAAAPAVLAVEAAADRGGKSAVADLRHEVYALMAHVKEEVEVERDSKALKAEQVAEAFRQRQDDRAMQYLIEFDCHPDFE